MASILDRTSNLLLLYRHHVGQSEVPVAYHFYVGLSLLAACVADRIWFEKKKGFRLTPNLYTFLLGPSAIGKGDAIDEALKFVRPDGRIHLYAGDATAPALLRHMARPASGPKAPDGPPAPLPNSRIYFVTPELAMSLGKGEKADSLIKLMTEMFSGRPYPLTKATVTRGEATLTGYTVNWLAGTTSEWLHDCVPREAIKGGFWGRILAYSAEYDLDRRFRRPEYPPDYDRVVAYLQEQLDALTYIEGEMRMTEQCERVEDLWYTWRPQPDDDDLVPSWKRAHDMVLKLAMLFSVAESPDLLITHEHFNQAIKIVDLAAKSLPALLDSASVTPETEGIILVAQLMRSWGRVSRQHLLATTYKRGITETRLNEIVNTLIGAGKLKRVAGVVGPAYVWMERRRGTLREATPEPPPVEEPDPSSPEP